MYRIDDVEVEVILCDVNNIEELIGYLEYNEISAITFSALSWTWNTIKCICDRICNRDYLILVGGPEVLNHGVDELKGKVMLLYGEGEKFFHDLAITLSQCSKIDYVLQMDRIGISEKKNGMYWCEGEWEYTMPLFDERFLKDIKIDGLGEVLYYETSRGCPYSCGYCGYNYRKTCSGFLSPYIEDEIAYMGRHDVRRIFVVDPILGGDKSKWIKIIKLV